MQDLSLHVLDIVENSITAGAKNVEIRVKEDLRKDLLVIEISDDGKGMATEFAEQAADPFVTTRSERRVGFGLSLFAEAARMSNGGMTVQSEPQRGTRIRATFQHSHIDRQPLGNIGETLLTLIVGSPQVNFSYFHRKDGMKFSFHSKNLKTQFKKQAIISPQDLKVLRKKLQEDFH